MNSTRREFIRYVINGLAATAIHYAVLSFNLHELSLQSAGLANLIAAIFGITASFFGSRYFVFRKNAESLSRQAVKFAGLYGVIALCHGAVLFAWTDRQHLDYRLGFLLATVLQVLLSYIGNKFLVFKA